MRMPLDDRCKARIEDLPHSRILQPAKLERRAFVRDRKLGVAEKAQFVGDVEELGRHAVRVQPNEVEAQRPHVAELAVVEGLVRRRRRGGGIRGVVPKTT